MALSRRFYNLRNETRLMFSFGEVWAILLAAFLCLSCAPTAPARPTPDTFPTPVVVPQPVVTQTPSAAHRAAVFAEQARVRLSTTFEHPGLNAYFEVIKVPAAEYGTTELYDLYKERGAKALLAAVDGPAGEKLQPFIARVQELSSLTRYEYLAVPVEVPLSGRPTVSDDARFVDALKGVALAPILDLHSSTSGPDYEPSLEFPLVALQLGRKVSFDATSLKHLTLGVDLQMEGLVVLQDLIKKRRLSVAQLRRLVAHLQSLEGNDGDFARVADGEYLFAVRRFENLDIESEKLSRELNGLAARYLQLRSMFEEHGPQVRELTLPPEAVGCELVSEEKDLLGPYNHWRKAMTQAAAVEIMAALELYHATEKRYPEELSALLKGYLTRLPTDLFGPGGEFDYRLEGTGYVLESLSEVGAHRW